MRCAPSFLPLLGAIIILLQLGLPTCQVLTGMMVLVMMLSVRQFWICQPTHPVTTLARSLAWPLLPLLTPVMMSSCHPVRSWQSKKHEKPSVSLFFTADWQGWYRRVDVDGSDAWWQCNGWQCQLDMIRQNQCQRQNQSLRAATGATMRGRSAIQLAVSSLETTCRQSIITNASFSNFREEQKQDARRGRELRREWRRRSFGDGGVRRWQLHKGWATFTCWSWLQLQSSRKRWL